MPNLIDNAAFGGPPRVLLGMFPRSDQTPIYFITSWFGPTLTMLTAATGAKGILVGHKLASWYYHNAYNPGEWQEMNREIFVKCSVKPKIRFMIVLASANIPIATRRARQYMVDSETTGCTCPPSPYLKAMKKHPFRKPHATKKKLTDFP